MNFTETPKPYVPLVVIASMIDGQFVRLHGMTYTPERGFIEPITNASVADIGGPVAEWYYQAVPLSLGNLIQHRKRQSFYRVQATLTRTKIPFVPRNRGRHLLRYKPYPGVVVETHVTVQISTQNHSPEWCVYRETTGSHESYLRPLSEFTPDRFRIIG